MPIFFEEIRDIYKRIIQFIAFRMEIDGAKLTILYPMQIEIQWISIDAWNISTAKDKHLSCLLNWNYEWHLFWWLISNVFILRLIGILSVACKIHFQNAFRMIYANSAILFFNCSIRKIDSEFVFLQLYSKIHILKEKNHNWIFHEFLFVLFPNFISKPLHLHYLTETIC